MLLLFCCFYCFCCCCYCCCLLLLLLFVIVAGVSTEEDSCSAPPHGLAVATTSHDVKGDSSAPPHGLAVATTSHDVEGDSSPEVLTETQIGLRELRGVGTDVEVDVPHLAYDQGGSSEGTVLKAGQEVLRDTRPTTTGSMTTRCPQALAQSLRHGEFIAMATKYSKAVTGSCHQCVLH